MIENVQKSSYIKKDYALKMDDKKIIGKIGFGKIVHPNQTAKKNILITGAGSYIGESFERYAIKYYKQNYNIDTIDTINEDWKGMSFSKYDIVYHVAGLAHADVENVSNDIKEEYYRVNTNLAIDIAQKAKNDGVKLFVFMSSMIIYGNSVTMWNKKIINEKTVPSPMNFYGDSKLQADVAVRTLADHLFKVAVIRAPMVYGYNCKGNYQTLYNLVRKSPVFPYVKNHRSMLYIDTLCEFLCQLFLVDINCFDCEGNVFMPQNKEWVNTSELAKEISYATNKKVIISKLLYPVILIGSLLPGKVGKLINKAFGNSCYEKNISIYSGIEYQNISLKESVKAEGKTK